MIRPANFNGRIFRHFEKLIEKRDFDGKQIRKYISPKQIWTIKHGKVLWYRSKNKIDMKVAFIGLGIMGSRMAANLVKNGVDLVVWNRSEAPAKELAANGAVVADSLESALTNSDLVFSMLSTPEVVAQLFFGEGGGLSKMKSGAIWSDCSTVNPSFSRRAASEAARFQIRFLDAPVAGTKPTAAAGQLAFFVGGNDGDLAIAKPYMEFMGAKIIHLGLHGMGSSFKMLVNSMLAQNMIIYSEAVHLGQKMGLSNEILFDTLPGLAVAAPFTKFKAEMMKADHYDTQFPLELMHKDLHLATLTGYENEQPLPMANIAKEIYAQAKADGLSRLDFAAVHRFLGSSGDV